MNKALESKLKEFVNGMRNPKNRQDFERFYKAESKKQIDIVEEVGILIKTKKGEKILQAKRKGDELKVELYDFSVFDLLFLVQPLVFSLIQKVLTQNPMLKLLHILSLKATLKDENM